MQEYFVTVKLTVRAFDTEDVEEWFSRVPWSLIETEDVEIIDDPSVEEVKFWRKSPFIKLPPIKEHLKSLRDRKRR